LWKVTTSYTKPERWFRPDLNAENKKKPAAGSGLNLFSLRKIEETSA
jgi:hypothetical protein